MMLDERTLVDHIVSLSDSWDGSALLGPIVIRLMGLDDAGWSAYLAGDGFTDAEVERLDDLTEAWIERTDLRRLTNSLAGVADLDSTAEMALIFQEWPSDDDWSAICQLVGDAGFPNPLDALCYAASELMRAASVAIAMESAQRSADAESDSDWEIHPDDVALGQAIADEGLMEDLKSWPTY